MRRPRPRYVCCSAERWSDLGPRVEPGFLEVLSPTGEFTAVRPEDAKGETSGHRLAFSRWLTRDDHPLTARVIVNRVWQHHFGRGIVGNSGQFRQARQTTHSSRFARLAGSRVCGPGLEPKKAPPTDHDFNSLPAVFRVAGGPVPGGQIGSRKQASLAYESAPPRG